MNWLNPISDMAIPTHSGVVSSYNAMDKIISKKIFLKKNMTPKYFTFEKSQRKFF